MNSHKNIMLLHSSSDMYGASKILLVVVEILKKNYGVTVILSESGPLVLKLKELNVDVRIVKLGILRRKYFNIPGLYNRFIVMKNAYRILSKLVKEKEINFIYSNTTGVLIGAYLALKTGTKHVWHIHEIIEKPKLFSKIIGAIINKYSDKAIVVSDEVKNYWKGAVSADKLVRIYNGIDYTQYIENSSCLRTELKLNDEDIIIGMVGRVNQWKGQTYFLSIAKLLKEKYKNLKFVLAGDAFPGFEYLELELNQFIIDNGLATRVFNLGYRDDIANVMKGYDIFVLPSILPDPLPTVVLESMACAKPVIATNHGGAKEMVLDGKTGFLIPWDDEARASEIFGILLDNKETRKQFGEQGRMRVMQEFSVSNFEKNLNKLFQSL